MEEKIKRLISWSRDKPQGPISIHLDPTNRCNLKCRFCWQRSHERKGLVDLKNEVSEQKLLEIVKEASELGVVDWLISGGGEPLVRYKTTIKVMKSIKYYSMRGDIISNGVNFQEKDIKYLVKSGWDRVRFSINTPDAGTHDSLVSVRGSFDKSVKSFSLFNKYKKELKRDKPELGFNTVINSRNYMKFPDLIKFLKSVGGEVLNVQTIILYSEKEKKWGLNKKQREEFRKCIVKALKTAQECGIKTNLHEYLKQELVESSNEVRQMKKIIDQETKKRQINFSEVPCFEPWYLMTIRANGIVGSCRLFGDKGTPIHNKTLKDIWFGEYFQKARQRLLNNNTPSYCANCGANEFIENKRIRGELKTYKCMSNSIKSRFLTIFSVNNVKKNASA